MFSKILAGIATVSAITTPSQPGAGVSLTKAGANNAKDTLAPYVFQYMKDITIPEVTFDGGFLKNLEIKLPQPPLSDININMEHATNGVELAASGVTSVIKSDFSYKYFITVTGQIEIDIKKLGIDIELDLQTQPGTPSWETAPKLAVQKTDIAINPADVDITLTGGLVAKIASVFIPFVKSTVLPTIVKTVQDGIKKEIDGEVNTDISIYGTQETLPQFGGVTADYGQMKVHDQITSDSYFEMAVNGTFFDKNHVQASAYTPVAFPVRNPTGKSLQGHLTDYTVNTFAEAGFSTGNTLDVTAILKKLVNLTVTTDNLGVVIPEILTKYGSGKAVGLAGKFITKPCNVKFTKSNALANIWIAITASVEGSEAIYAEFNAAQAAAMIQTTNGVVFGDFNTAHIGTIDSASFRTAISGMTAASLQKGIQGVVDTNVAILNVDLKKGVTIPALFGIQGDIEINPLNGFIEGGVDATPATFAAISDIMIAVADELRYARKINKLESLKASWGH